MFRGRGVLRVVHNDIFDSVVLLTTILVMPITTISIADTADNTSCTHRKLISEERLASWTSRDVYSGELPSDRVN
jgi:hypothetical protein